MFKEILKSEIDLKKTLIIYFVYISIVIILGLIYSNLKAVKNPDIILNNNHLNIIELQFNHGKLVKNIVEKKQFFQEINDIKYYLLKLPIFPILLSLILSISKNYFFFLISKAVILFTLFYYTINVFCKDNGYNTKYLLFF